MTRTENAAWIITRNEMR